jgi:hypothetical protein
MDKIDKKAILNFVPLEKNSIRLGLTGYQD